MLINNEPSLILKDKKIILLDNDFLGELYESRELLEDVIKLDSSKKLYLHPFTEFEFLRNVFLPRIRILKEQFISSQFFGHIKAENHLKIFQKIFDNSLLLSKIYAHKNLALGSSFIDLTLASLLMYLKTNAILITGNKRDFPSCLFDTLSVLNFESKEGNIRAIGIVAFNQAKFDRCYKDLQKLEA